MDRIGSAFEILVTPERALLAKDCKKFLSFFCGDSVVSFDDFTELVVYHAFMEAFLLESRDPALEIRKRLFLALATPTEDDRDDETGGGGGIPSSQVTHDDAIAEASGRLLRL
ncbi:hypothetical protein HK105_204236 [Polyrhizophydium stewartii]|uniref:Uncharacterized protein n=1 Tax=Polyrhizophydium stewartii TaxID=2732419 RepID=A0ABR4N9D2_9FUNG